MRGRRSFFVCVFFVAWSSMLCFLSWVQPDCDVELCNDLILNGRCFPASPNRKGLLFLILEYLI